jgi:hypothetical protein
MGGDGRLAEARRKNREAQQRFRERQRAAAREAEAKYQEVSGGRVKGEGGRGGGGAQLPPRPPLQLRPPAVVQPCQLAPCSPCGRP